MSVLLLDRPREWQCAVGIQRSPAQNQMQVPSGYGLYPQNYVAPSGHYSQGPGKMTSLPLDSQSGDYYPGLYTVPTQNVVTPNTASQQPGAQQMYGRVPPAPHVVGSALGSFQGAMSSASHLQTSASQPYSSFVNHYNSPAMYSVNSSVASQGLPSTCGHYALSAVSNASYPGVPYPSLPAGDPYRQQMLTSQSALTVRPIRESSLSGQNTAVSHPSPLPPPPSQQYQQQQSLSGYSTFSWSAPGLPSTQDNLIRNHTSQVAANNNPTNTGVDSSSTTSSASPMPNSYDALEGGSYPDMLSSSASSPAPEPAPEPDPAPAPAPAVPQPSKLAKPFGYGYPALQPGYQNATTPLNSGVPPSSPGYSGFQQYAQQLPVITSNTIVRCRSCRTYINPFVSFIDQRRWKCNLCYRINDVPEEFMYNPITRSYGEPHKRPEVQNSTVEFIASSDYMVVQHLGPATDFYKKLALDCSGQQTAVDLFLLSSQYSDLASLGLSMHTFHGNFFVRSTDLLSLANINPDAGFAVQLSIEESLTDTSLVCFQTALLYTSSKAVDRSISSSLSDARDALVNAVVDSLSAYGSTVSNLQHSALIAPSSLKLFPLYVLALLKQKVHAIVPILLDFGGRVDEQNGPTVPAVAACAAITLPSSKSCFWLDS
ncbi:hypothetical protein CB1_001130003 [Camelus ferus]|nr:hypothetical protein CB1_001130003 [Camelus ferus]